MEWEKLEIIEWLINNASNKEIDGMYQFLVQGNYVDGLIKFFTREEYRQFKEEFNETEETQIWED